MSEDKLLDIESKLERMHIALKRQEKELDSCINRPYATRSGACLFIVFC